MLFGILAVLIIAFVISTAYSCSPTTFHVNGQEVSAARSTTYQGLIDQGLLDVKKGNLVAVDDEVLEEGGGKDPTVFLDGEAVDLGARVSEAGNVTAENGEDEIEPYTATQDVTPSTMQIAKGTSDGGTGSFDFYQGVLHVITDPGQDGIVETRTGETTGKTATVKVQDVKPRLMENLEAKLSSNNKLVALTFDDGPNPVATGTNEMLDVLAKHNVKATFFMLGTQVEEYPELARKVADAGHQVCSHSYSHDESHYLNQTSLEDVRTQIEKARTVIGQATGTEPHYMRPPGGNINEEAILAADTLSDGYIGWSVDTTDWMLPGSDSIVQTVLDQVEPGAVLLMHDGGGDRSQTVEAVDRLIPQLQDEGYRFVTIDELVQAILDERGGTGSSQASGDQSESASQQDRQSADADADAQGQQDGASDEDEPADGESEDEESEDA